MCPLILKYRVTGTLEKNRNQTILLAAPIDKPQEVAVINEIKWADHITPELAHQIKAAFTNLEGYEESNGCLRLVTRYHQGYPLRKYLESFNPSDQQRLNLCYEMLQGLSAYDSLPCWIQNILIDEGQIILWEDTLSFNELLILADSETPVDPTSFNPIAHKLGRLMRMTLGDSEENCRSTAKLFERLMAPASGYSSIGAVYDDFQKIFLYDLFLDSEASVPINDTNTAPIDSAVDDRVGVPIPMDPGTEGEEPPESDGIRYIPEIPEEPFPDTISETVADPAPEVVPTAQLSSAAPEPEALPAAAPPDVPQQEDPLDAELERNLDLFFKRDAAQASEENGFESKKLSTRSLKGILAVLLIITGLLCILYAATASRKADIEPAFKKVQTDGIWYLQNTTVIPKATQIRRYEWNVLSDGKTIAAYDSEDLTLPLEKDGRYEVTLRMQDSKGRWSPTFKDTLDHRSPAKKVAEGSGTSESGVDSEPLSRFSLQYDNTRISQDTAICRSGNVSLKFQPGPGSTLLTVRDFYLSGQGIVSFWILGEANQTIQLTFRGYNRNQERFSKSLTHKATGNGQWDMIQFPVKAEGQLENMTVSVHSSRNVWLDDLSIESYK